MRFTQRAALAAASLVALTPGLACTIPEDSGDPGSGWSVEFKKVEIGAQGLPDPAPTEADLPTMQVETTKTASPIVVERVRVG